MVPIFFFISPFYSKKRGNANFSARQNVEFFFLSKNRTKTAKKTQKKAPKPRKTEKKSVPSAGARLAFDFFSAISRQKRSKKHRHRSIFLRRFQRCRKKHRNRPPKDPFRPKTRKYEQPCREKRAKSLPSRKKIPREALCGRFWNKNAPK
jgi:hypothetical protein